MSSIGLIISTYNWPEALAACLRSVAAQKRMPDTIIVADDGSETPTGDCIVGFSRLPIKHVWHEDLGFRLAGIRNKAIAACNCDYIISLDGDMLLHPAFVADHEALLQKRCFRQGSRIPMSAQLSASILNERRPCPTVFSSGTTRRYKALRQLWLARLLAGTSSDAMSVRGCHQAFWREDLIRVNGFNEAMCGWGREDNEIGSRLINAGILRRNILQAAVAFHLYHEERSRNGVSENDHILEHTRSEHLTRCKNGLDQWLNQSDEHIVADHTTGASVPKSTRDVT